MDWFIRAWAVSGRSSNPSEAADLRKAICMVVERKFVVTLACLVVALRWEMECRSAIGM